MPVVLAAILIVACGADGAAESSPSTTGLTAAAPTSSSEAPTTIPATSQAPTTSVPTTTLAPTTTIPEPTSADLYASDCAVCHGAELEGGVGPALGPGGHAEGHDDAELIDLITNGKNEMPAFGEKLTAEQIAGLVAFIRAAHEG